MDCGCSATNMAAEKGEECGCMSCAVGRAQSWAGATPSRRVLARKRTSNRRSGSFADPETWCWTCDALRALGAEEEARACEVALDCPVEAEAQDEETSEPDQGDHLDIVIADCVNEAVSVYPASLDRGWRTVSAGGRVNTSGRLGAAASLGGSRFAFEVEAGLATDAAAGSIQPVAVHAYGDDPVTAAVPDACLGLSAALMTAFPFTQAFRVPFFRYNKVDFNWLTLRVSAHDHKDGCWPPYVANVNESQDVFVISGVRPYVIYSHEFNRTTGLLKLRIWVGLANFPSFFVTPNSESRPAAFSDLPAELTDGSGILEDSRGTFFADWMSLVGDVTASVEVDDQSAGKSRRVIACDARYSCAVPGVREYATWFGIPSSLCFSATDSKNATDVAAALGNVVWGEMCFVDGALTSLLPAPASPGAGAVISPPPFGPLGPSQYARRIREYAGGAFKALFGADVRLSQTVSFRSPPSQQYPLGQDMSVLRRWTLTESELVLADHFWQDDRNLCVPNSAATWVFNVLDSDQFLGTHAFGTHAGIEAAAERFSAKVPCDCV